MESYDVCMFGELVMPLGKAQSEAWRLLRIDGRVFTDWPDAFRWSGAFDEANVTVGRWLDDARTFGGNGRAHFFDVDQRENADGTVAWTLRARVDDTDYETYRRAVATLFRLAGAVGAYGRLFLLSAPGTEFGFGYHVAVDPSFSALHAMDDVAIREASASL